MRVVLDTNVLVSGVISPHGPPGRILDGLLAGTLTAVYDDRLMSEYREVLLRPTFGFTRKDVETLLDFIRLNGESVSAEVSAVALPDPDDLPFLEVAMSAGAEAIVTGNVKRFTPRHGRHRVAIWTPAQLVAKLTRGTDPPD
jgi:putative PIN family toxin of toxin-antitoxin system